MRKFNPEKELYKIQHGNKNKIILFVISLLIVGIIGYSFALYQVRYSKRIIYTKVAPFSSSDLDLAIYVDGERKSAAPNKEDGYTFVTLLCDKEYKGNVVWDEENKFLSLVQVQMPIPNKCNAYFVSKDKTISKEFVYSSHEEEYKISQTGYYKLEVWGAQGGGHARYGTTGGLGSYASELVYLEKDTTIFIVVGGQGAAGTNHDFTWKGAQGGYNGGGNSASAEGNDGGGGGGATHIAKVSGLLPALESSKAQILIIAGGGGGASWSQNGNGYNGNLSNVFGQGASGSTGWNTAGGGGGGYYGGLSGAPGADGGYIAEAGTGGSSYIIESAVNSTITHNTRTGNGMAKITYLG